jgi:hypothetical protein
VVTGRWTPRRKAELVAAIDASEITVEEAVARYALSAEELALWRQAIAAHGVPGLRVTRIQCYTRRQE